MGRVETPREFTQRDLDLLVEILSLNDSMSHGAHAVQLIEELLSYPIESFERIGEAFRLAAKGRRTVTIGRCEIALEQVRRYLPDEYFPVADRSQLVSRVVLGFEAERMDRIEALTTRQTHSAEQISQREEGSAHGG